MPSDAPTIKVQNTRDYGAEIISYDRATESREEIGRDIARDRGAIVVPSYDDPHIIGGQGTVGLEIVQQCDQISVVPDAVLVCCGGGGLSAGMATAVKGKYPATSIYCVEPVGFDDYARSLRSGRREQIAPDFYSFCDALLAPTPGELTFSINSSLLTGGLVVSDDEVAEAMRFAFATLKLVVEPGGAVALAAALSGKINVRDKSVCVVLSGGNVDPELYSKTINCEQPATIATQL